MYLKEINERNAISFTRDLLDYYSCIDNGSINNIYTSNDEESFRDNVGWYCHEDDQHKININIPNILCAKFAIEQGILDNDSFYAFLTLCVGHEFRHFLQGRCIYDGQEIDGYGQSDVFNSELMLYVRYFFDAYYLLNKGYVKYEVDAEKAMTDAVNFYANIQNRGFISPTLPIGCKNYNEIVSKLSDRLKNNLRNPDVQKTLFVYNPRFYTVHKNFGLDENKVITSKFLHNYKLIENGSKQDLLVAKQILSLLERPVESLEEFPQLKKRYLEKRL